MKRLVIALVIVASSAIARADATKAEALFDEGRKLLSAGDTAAACKRFEASQAEERALGTLLNLADCYERSERLADAEMAFREAAAWATKKHEPKRVEVALARAQALARRRAAAPPAPTLASMPPPGPPALSSMPAPEPVADDVEPAWAARRTLPTSPPPPAHQDIVEAPLRVRRRPLSRPAIAAIGSGASAIALFAAGGALGAVARSTWHDAKSYCDAELRCEPTGVALGTRAGRYADASTALFAVGGVAGAAAIGLGVWTAIRERRAERAPALTLVPVVSPALVGGSLQLRF